MHEMALCRDVLDIVVEEATKVHATDVRNVYVTVGEVRDIIDDIFVDMFHWLARDTIAKNAKVVLTRVPLTVECKDCGNVYHLNVRDESTWPCPKCGKRNYTMKSGMEFYISNIEVCTDDPAVRRPEDDLAAMVARTAAANRAEAERARAEAAASGDAATAGGTAAAEQAR